MAVAGIPQNVNLQQGNGQVYLSWDIVAGATSYQAQRSTDGVTFSNLVTSAVNSYLDTTGTIGTLYYYQIASINGSGTGSYCSAQSIVPTPTAEMALGQIRLASQQRADRVGSNFVSLAEWNSYINQSYFELYDILITLYEDYYVNSITFQTDGTTSQYPLPDGTLYSAASPFYKLWGVDIGLAANTNGWVTLKKFDAISRNRYVFPQLTSTYLGVFNLQYRLVGNTLMFIPTPAGGQTIRMWYIPRVSQLLKDTDIMDGISGWSEYVIVDAAIKALQKEESDVTVLMLQKQELMQRINGSAMNRDAGQPDCISNVRTQTERYGGYGGLGYDGAVGGL